MTKPMRFEATCQCGQPITTASGGWTWRHKKAPTIKHTGAPEGVMRQI